MKKSTLLSILLVLAFSLTVLGMRNPSLDRNRGPKQQPRAVLEEVSKSPSVKVCKFHADPWIPHQVVLGIPPFESAPFNPLTTSQISSPAPASRQSRSPPSPVTVISA